MNKQRAQRFYPIGLLREEIEIHFHHEKDERVAKWKWERRKARINWENVFVKLSEDPGICTVEMLEEFENLDLPNKVCFTKNEYPRLPSTICIPGYFEEGAAMFWLSLKYFHAMEWLAQKDGPGARKYTPGNFQKVV